MRSSLIALALAALLAPACVEDDEGGGGGEETFPPVPILAKIRAVNLDFDDSEAIHEFAEISPDGIREAMTMAVLRRQLFDQEHLLIHADGSAEFEVRIQSLAEEPIAALYPAEARIVVLDLLNLAGDALFCDSSIVEVRKCNFTHSSQEYPEEALSQAFETVNSLKPKVFAFGAGMNRLASGEETAADYQEFVRFLSSRVAANLNDVKLTTVIDWEAFITDVEAHAAGLVAEGTSEAGARDLAFEAVWAEQFGALIEVMDVVAIQSRPTASSVAQLPDDYYRRLVDLIPDNKEVLFVSLTWTTNSPDDNLEAIKFLKRWRWLVGGLNVIQVAWSRLVDVSESRCGRWPNLGLRKAACNGGLLSEVGRQKSSWGEFVDESVPSEPPQSASQGAE